MMSGHSTRWQKFHFIGTLNHVNVGATDETKIVTTKLILGFYHGQLRFCLLVRIGPKEAFASKLIGFIFFFR